MPQIVQLKRRIGAGGPGGPAVLAAGELAYNSNGQTLHVGADTANTIVELVGANRQLEIHANGGNQTVAAGTKTWAPGAKIGIGIADLGVTGGAAGDTITTNGLGVLTFGPAAAGVVSSTPAQVTAGTDDTTFISPLDLRSQTGADATALTTVATTIVPAINELKVAVDALGAESQFVGTFNATATTITWAPGTGAGNTLPPATQANNGWYMICTVGGAAPPTGATAGTYTPGDWIISNGAVWTSLFFGGVSTTTADQVPTNPAIGSWTDVQMALEGLAAENTTQDTDIAAKVDRVGDTMTGPLLLVNQTPTAVLEAAAKGYVDTKVAGPATSLLDRIATFADATGRVIKDSGITVGTIQADAKAYVDTQDNLRVLKAGDTMTGPLVLPAAMPTLPAHAAHKAYVDQQDAAQDAAQAAIDLAQDALIAAAATTVYVDTQDNLRVLKAGDTMTGPLVLPVPDPTLGTHAAHKQYVDDSIAAMVGGSTVQVTAPELTGDGSAATPVKFMGITIAANSVLELLGNGLSATGLDLVLVDGGTF